jgi:hypothetical protein
MMDRDLADIKQRMDAQDLLLQALHVTQSNHTQRLTRIAGPRRQPTGGPGFQTGWPR